MVMSMAIRIAPRLLADNPFMQTETNRVEALTALDAWWVTL